MRNIWKRVAQKSVGRRWNGDYHKNSIVSLHSFSSQTNCNVRQVCRLYSSSAIVYKESYNKYRQPLSVSLWDELQQENARTQSLIDKSLYEELLQESLAASEVDTSPPEYGPTGTWQYETSTHSTNQLLYIRSFQDKTQVVLNLESNVDIHALSLAVDETLIACLCTVNSESGKEEPRQEIRLRHIESGKVIIATVPSGFVSLEFGPILPDGRHSLYLVGTDEQGRSDRVYGTLVTLLDFESSSHLDVNEPRIIFQSSDPAVMVDVQRTKGCQYVAIQAMKKSSNEIFLSKDPTSETLLSVIPRHTNLQYHLDIGEQDDVMILVSENGEEYKVLETTVDSLPLDPENYNVYYANEEIQSDEEYVISDMELFRGHLIFYERSTTNGLERIRTHQRLDGHYGNSFIIPMPTKNTKCYKLIPAGNIHRGSHVLRFKIEAPFHVGRFFTYDLDDRQYVLEAVDVEKEDSNVVVTEREFVSSADGTRVPLSLIYENKIEGEEKLRPVILVGYGAYGEPMDLSYNPMWPSLLKRGYVLAFAHTRGGSDLGRKWYLAGCRENKTKGIDDFEACAMYLKSRYSSGNLSAFAFSAGGVLVGAVMNRKPSLFDNVVLTNSFLDVYNTLKNPDLYLTSHEWDEYGNPLQDTNAADEIRSYCPTTNVKAMENCPRTLVIGTMDDENVPFWNAVIFAKKLRDYVEGPGSKDNVCLYIEDKGGHHFASNRRLPIAAMSMTFIIQN